MAKKFHRIAFRPVGIGERKEIAALGGAGIVDQNVEAAEMLPDGFDQRRRGAIFAQIHGLAMRRAAMPFDGGGGLAERRGVAPGQHQVAALLGQRQRNAAADAAARSGHQRDFSAQSQVHACDALQDVHGTYRPMATPGNESPKRLLLGVTDAVRSEDVAMFAPPQSRRLLFRRGGGRCPRDQSRHRQDRRQRQVASGFPQRLDQTLIRAQGANTGRR